MTDQTPQTESTVAKVEAAAKTLAADASAVQSKMTAVLGSSVTHYVVGASAGVAAEKVLGVVAHLVALVHKL